MVKSLFGSEADKEAVERFYEEAGGIRELDSPRDFSYLFGAALLIEWNRFDKHPKLDGEDQCYTKRARNYNGEAWIKWIDNEAGKFGSRDGAVRAAVGVGIGFIKDHRSIARIRDHHKFNAGKRQIRRPLR